jgi:hypothetical protein
VSVVEAGMRVTVTKLLDDAFAVGSRLPEEGQDEVARLLIDQVEAAFDRCIERTSHQLAPLARATLQDLRPGRAEPLDPDTL